MASQSVMSAHPRDKVLAFAQNFASIGSACASTHRFYDRDPLSNFFVVPGRKESDTGYVSTNLIQTDYPDDFHFTFGQLQWALNVLYDANLIPPRRYQNWRDEMMYVIRPILYLFLEDITDYQRKVDRSGWKPTAVVAEEPAVEAPSLKFVPLLKSLALKSPQPQASFRSLKPLYKPLRVVSHIAANTKYAGMRSSPPPSSLPLPSFTPSVSRTTLHGTAVVIDGRVVSFYNESQVKKAVSSPSNIKVPLCRSQKQVKTRSTGLARFSSALIPLSQWFRSGWIKKPVEKVNFSADIKAQEWLTQEAWDTCVQLEIIPMLESQVEIVEEDASEMVVNCLYTRPEEEPLVHANYDAAEMDPFVLQQILQEAEFEEEFPEMLEEVEEMEIDEEMHPLDDYLYHERGALYANWGSNYTDFDVQEDLDLTDFTPDELQTILSEVILTLNMLRHGIPDDEFIYEAFIEECEALHLFLHSRFQVSNAFTYLVPATLMEFIRTFPLPPDEQLAHLFHDHEKGTEYYIYILLSLLDRFLDYVQSQEAPDEEGDRWSDSDWDSFQVVNMDVGEANSEEKQENVTFEDGRVTESDEGFRQGQVLTTATHLSMQEGEWHVRNILAKPMKIATVTWNVADAIGGTIYQGLVPGDMIRGPHASLMRTFTFFRGHPKIMVKLNSTKFHHGILLGVFQPFINNLPFQNWFFLNNLTSFPHFKLDASLSNSGELQIPFAHMDTYFNLFVTREWNSLGLFSLIVYNTLGSTLTASQSVDLTVWVSYENCELHQPTIEHPIALPSLEANFGWIAAIGSIARIFGGIGSVITGINLGGKALFGSPTKEEGGGREVVPFEPPRWVPNAVSSMNFGDGLDNCNRLSLTTGSCAVDDSGLVSFTGDDMNLLNLCQIYQRLEVLNWNSQFVSGHVLAYYPVCPTMAKVTPNPNNPDYYTYEAPLISYLSRAFKYWRGTLKYKITIVSSVMQSGRLMISYVPGVYVTDSPELLEAANLEILDLQERHESEIVIPFMSERKWLRCDRFYPYNTPEAAPTLAMDTGFITIVVLNRLSSPDATQQTIQVNVELCAGDDFKLNIPVDLSYYRFTGVLPSPPPTQVVNMDSLGAAGREDSLGGTPITKDGGLLAPAMQNMGEDCMSMKLVCGRYMKVFETTGTFGHRGHFMFSNNPHVSSINVAFANQYHLQFRPILSHFAELFTFWRGSLRYKVVFTGLTQHFWTTVYHVPGVFAQDLTVNHESVDEALEVGSLENMGVIVAQGYIQSSMEFEIPFYTPYSELLTVGELTARSSTGTIFVTIHSPFEDTAIALSLYQAIGSDFSFNYLRGAPRMTFPSKEQDRQVEDDAHVLYPGQSFSQHKRLASKKGEMVVNSLWSSFNSTLESVTRTSNTINDLLSPQAAESHGLFAALAMALKPVEDSFGMQLADWSVVICDLVSAFNSFLQADSLFIKAMALVSILSKLLGKALSWAKTHLYDICMKVLSSINECNQGNQHSQAGFLDFVAPLLAMLACAGAVLGFKTIPDDKETTDIVNKLNGKLRLFNGMSLAVTNLKRVYEGLKETIESLIEWIMFQFAPQVLARMQVEQEEHSIVRWVQRIDEISTLDYVNQCNMDYSLKNEIMCLAENGRRLQEKIIQGEISREASIIREYLKKIFLIEQAVMKAVAALPFRVDPYCLHITGEPGCGKSTIIQEILFAGCDAAGFPKEDRVLSINPSDSFMSENLKSTTGSIYAEDLGAMVKAEQWELIFNLFSNNAYQPNMAFKKGTYFRSEAVGFTSNNAYPRPNNVHNHVALHRRINRSLWEMRFKENAPRQPAFNHENCEFRRLPYTNTDQAPPIGNMATGPWVSKDEFKRQWIAEFMNHLRIQHNLVVTLLVQSGYKLPEGFVFNPMIPPPAFPQPPPRELSPEQQDRLFEALPEEFRPGVLDWYYGLDQGEQEVNGLFTPTLDANLMSKHSRLCFFSDQEWVSKVEWHCDKRHANGGSFVCSDISFNVSHGEYVDLGWNSWQSDLFECTSGTSSAFTTIKSRFCSFFSDVRDSIKSFMSSNSWLETLKQWPFLLAGALIALTGFGYVSKKVIHSCICSSMRYMGYRCVKCGKWPKFDDCKDKDWLLSEWQLIYGPVEKYEDFRVTTLEEENDYYTSNGMGPVQSPSIGTQMGPYTKETGGLARKQVFARSGPYTAETSGLARKQVFANAGNQRAEDLYMNRIAPATYRVKTMSASGRECSLNGVAIGGRLFIVPFHFVHTSQGSFEVYHGNAWMKIDLTTTKYEKLLNKDLVIMEMPPQFHQHKSIVHQFISEKELSNLEVTQGYLAKRAGIYDCTVLQFDRIQAIREMKYACHEGPEPVYYYAQGAWSYRCSGLLGCCGSLLVSTSNRVGGQILGFHVAGDETIGTAQLITKEMLEPYLTTGKLGTPIPATSECGTEMTVQGHFSHAGSVSEKSGVYQPKTTNIRRTPLYGKISPPVSGPSVMRSNDPRLDVPTNVMRKAIEKYGQVPIEFNKIHVRMVEVDLEREIMGWDLRRTPKILSDEEAVLGIPGLEGFERLPLNTSPGYPYVLSRPSSVSGKAYMFDENGSIIDPELKARFTSRKEMAKAGERVESVWTSCLKDERRPLEKIKAGSTRLFTMPPVDFSLLLRKYSLDFVVAVKDHRHESFCKVGIDPQSLEWTTLSQSLLREATEFFAGDFTRFDGTIPPQLTVQFFKHLEEFLVRAGIPREDVHNVLSVLCDESIHTVQIAGRQIIVTHTGNKSGSPITVIINSFVNFYYMALAYLDIMARNSPQHATMYYFRKFVTLAIYGDDNVVGVHPTIVKLFTQEAVSQFLEKYGIIYTNESKSGISALRPLTEISFLKNRFAKHEGITDIWVPQMSMDTIHELLNWTRDSPNPDELLADNCNDALRFAYFHGFDFFESLRKRITQELNGIGKKLHIMTYTDFHFWFLFVIGRLQSEQGVNSFFQKVARNGNGALARLVGRCTMGLPYKILSLTSILRSGTKHKVTDDRYAIAIPSGEGKSWLCQKFPSVFVDHDELLLPAARRLLKEKGLSATALRKMFDLEFPVDDRRILLCHHPDNTGRKILGAYVLPKSNYIRANAYQRARMPTTAKKMDRDARNAEILSLAKEVEPGLFGGSFSI